MSGASGARGFRVTKAWGFLTVDPDDDEEGFAAFATPNGTILPMVATDQRRLEQLRPLAAGWVARFGRPVRLVEFTGMRELETIHPAKARGRG